MKFAFVSPSGCGKTTIVNLILNEFPYFVLSKSYTTRAMRHEKDDEYIFVTREEFHSLQGRGFFLETEEIFSNLYGTPAIYEENIIFNIDIKGINNLKKLFPVISIGIYTSKDHARSRLINRGDTTNIDERMSRYEFEIHEMKKLDFMIENENLEDALTKVRAIFKLYLP
jgi:guanylate kinase